MSGFLIDATALLDLERGRIDLGERLDGRASSPYYLSLITVSQLLEGVHRARGPSEEARRSAWVESVVERFPLLPLDLPTARVHARLRARLERRGATVRASDLWLASTCIAHELTLVVGDERELAELPGLEVERWSGAPADQARAS